MSQFAGFGKQFQTPGVGSGSPQILEVPVEIESPLAPHLINISDKLDLVEHNNEKFTKEVIATFTLLQEQLSTQQDTIEIVKKNALKRDPYKIVMIFISIINLMGIGAAITYLFMPQLFP